MLKTRTIDFLVCILVCVAIAHLSCSEEGEGPNLPPDTIIVSGPQPGSTHSYKGKIVLSGSDPDGFISSYEYAWLDGLISPIVADTIKKWTSTKKDTIVFEVKADQWSQEQEKYLRTYTFVARAVDNKGAHDPSPVYLTFTATTTPPRTKVVYPGPEGRFDATVPECITIRWEAKDDDGTPVMYRYALKAYDDWPYAQPPPEGDTRWSPWLTSTEISRWIDSGLSEQILSFYVQAMDNAGAIERGFEDGANHVRLHIDTKEVLGPAVTLLCYKGNHMDKPGSLIASRSTANSAQMEIPVEVIAGDSIYFEMMATPGKFATAIIGVRFRQNDDQEPHSWLEPTPQNQLFPPSGFLKVNLGEEITIYAWARDNYCQFGSTARAYMILAGKQPSP